MQAFTLTWPQVSALVDGQSPGYLPSWHLADLGTMYKRVSQIPPIQQLTLACPIKLELDIAKT